MARPALKVEDWLRKKTTFCLPFLVSLFLLETLQAAVKTTPSRHLLDIVLENYDLDKWPTFPIDDAINASLVPTRSNISVDIMFISSINVEAMDLTIDMYLNQNWNDKRLRFSETVSKRRLHLKTVEQMRRIWSPDTYIVNAKQANFHHITTENRVVYIYGNGDVFYSARITAKVACEMKFHSFPMDSQDCMLHLASYAYTVDILQMFWKEGSEGPVSYKQDVELNQFSLTNVTTIECLDIYPDGGYPCLKILFRFERRVAHHLIQTFLPTVLIVTISWVSFYIQADAVPARIALGITTLLTMITLNSGTKQGLPPVSYVKAIDVWMGVCTFFVFSAIWEYVIVCILVRRPLGCQRHQNQTAAAGIDQQTKFGSSASPLASRFIRNSLSALVIPNMHAEDAEDVLPPHFHANSSTVHSNTNNRLASFHQLKEISQNNTLAGPLNHLQPQMRIHRASSTPNAQQLNINTSDQVLKVVWEPRTSQAETAVQGNFNEFHLQTSPTAEQIISRKKRKFKVKCSCTSEARNAQERSKRVDIIARVAYPLMFLLFNLFYWPYYLNWSVSTTSTL